MITRDKSGRRRTNTEVVSSRKKACENKYYTVCMKNLRNLTDSAAMCFCFSLPYWFIEKYKLSRSSRAMCICDPTHTHTHTHIHTHTHTRTHTHTHTFRPTILLMTAYTDPRLTHKTSSAHKRRQPTANKSAHILSVEKKSKAGIQHHTEITNDSEA